jgi:hypothetical protein
MFKGLQKPRTTTALSWAALASAFLNIGPLTALAAESGNGQPAIAGSLAANPNPTKFDVGPFGNIAMTGVLTGFTQWQNNATAGDRTGQADLTNAQVFIQKNDGVFQFFIQGGAYSLPALGVPYVEAIKTTSDQWGPLPQAFIKLAPNDNWSIMVGKLTALAGLENTFTFQNLNIERGLLWNQTNSVNHGIQANYSAGSLAFALSWNDGFYSDQFTWLSGSATWEVNKDNSFQAIWGANTRTTNVSTTATPLLQDNSRIYNLTYTYSPERWTVSPYLQYTYIPAAPSIGVSHDAATYGAAVLVNYTFEPTFRVGGLSLVGFSLPFRVEYTASTGNAADGAPNLLYGPGSTAWSITISPTYQYKRFFTRAEFSYVGTKHTTTGFAFGPNGSNSTQARFLIESGFLF